MRATVELLADSSQIKTAEKDLQRLNQTGSKTEAVTKKAGKSFSGFGRNAGQAGIQVQQFVGQVQGGQNALLALSQQGADLGIVLGVPLVGVIIGLGASLAGFLLPALFNSKDALEQLEEIAERLGRTLSVDTKTGVVELSDSLLGLARRSRVLANIQIAQSISDASEQIKVATGGIKESISDLSLAPFSKLQSLLDDAGISLEDFAKDTSRANVVVASNGSVGLANYEASLKSLQRRFELTRPQAVQFAAAIGEFQRVGGAQGVAALRSGLEDLSIETGNSNQKLVKFTAALIPLFQQVSQGVDISNELRIALSGVASELGDDLGDAATGFQTKVQDLTVSLRTQIIALEEGARAAEIFATVQRLAGTEQENQIPLIVEQIAKKYELIDAQKASTEAAKIEAETQKQALTEIGKAFSEFQSQQTRLESAAAGNVGLTRLQALEKQYSAERALLLDAQNAGFESEVAYKERLLQLETEFSESKKALGDSFELIDFEAFENRAAGAFAAVATGAQTGEQAVQGLAIGLIQEGVGALIKYGLTAATTWAADALGFSAAQGVKTTAAVTATGIQTAASTAAVGTLTGVGIAAGGTLAAAYAPAAAAASIATAGGAPAAATPIALGSIGTIIAALVGGLALGSVFGRATGGQTRDGQPYLVGERGPELFTPNSSGGGRVTPFNQLMNQAGGNGQMVTDNSNVNINVTGAYQTGEDLLLANRDLIYRIVSDAKRRQGQRF